MKTIPIDEEIMAQVRQLPYRYRQQVLAFVRALRMSQPKGIPGSELLKFAGAIEGDDLEIMSEAIKEGCEQIDMDCSSCKRI